MEEEDQSATVSHRARVDPDSILKRAATDLPIPRQVNHTDADSGHVASGHIPTTSGDQGIINKPGDHVPPSPSPSLIPILHTARANTTIAFSSGAGSGRIFSNNASGKITTTVAASGGGRAVAAGAPTTVRFTLRMKTGHRRKPVAARKPLTPCESVSDGYFSDSDDDEKRNRFLPISGRTSTDFLVQTCQQVYEKSCRTLKIVPRQHFLKQLGNQLLDMSNEGLSRKELNAVCASLVNFEKLFGIDFSGNQLSERGVNYVCQLLERNSYITALKLSECEISVAGLRDFVPVVPKVSTLQKLDISGNKFRDEAGELLAQLISTAQDLTHLCLRHNELRESGGVYIGDAIAKNEGLESLDLSWNHLRGKGAECVALALLKNKTLTSLDLSWNGFGFEGCCALGHALHENTTLKELDLTCNRIHPAALYELLKGLLCNKTLTVVKLGQNPIPAHMTSAILAKFRDATDMNLMTLDFTGIVVDKLFEVVLDEIKEKKPYFVCLYDRSLPVHKARWEDLDKLHKGVLNIDPMRILFFIKKNLRIIDLFRQMDTDRSATISRDEIRKALLKQDLPVSSASLDVIMAYLDTNKDGEIDLAELADGERRFKRETIAEKQQWEAQERLSIEQAQKNGLPADLGGSGARFTRSFRPDLNDLHGESQDALGKPPKFKRENASGDMKLPNIQERPGNVTQGGSNSAGNATDRSASQNVPSTLPTLPNTVR